MNKKGFTLIELLAAITILGILATIAINVSIVKINETKEASRETLIKSLELAAKSYVIDNTETLSDFSRNDNIYITLETLIKAEKFNNSLVDPTTKKALPLQDSVYVTRTKDGQITAYYDIDQRTKTKLVLNGSYNTYVKKGSTYTDQGVVATSTSGTTVSATKTGTVNTNTVGNYVITYTHGGNSITRNVIVYE